MFTMSLIRFQDWIIAKESSAATRSKTAAALGLGPDVASVFGHSTPPAWQTERLLKKLKSSKKGSNSELPGEEPAAPKWYLPEQSPDYSFDKWVGNLLKKKKETDEQKEKADKEEKEIDSKSKSRLKEREKEGDNKLPQGKEEKGNFKWDMKKQDKPEKEDDPEDDKEKLKSKQLPEDD